MREHNAFVHLVQYMPVQLIRFSGLCLPSWFALTAFI